MSRGYPDWTRAPESWERDPLSLLHDVHVLVGPHAAFTRDSYTVPAGRAAIIQAAFVQVIQITAPSVFGEPLAYLILVGGALDAILARATIGPLGVVTQDSMALRSPVVIFAGETLNCITSDGSTGGTVRYNLHARIVEISAASLPTVTPPLSGLIS